MSLPREFVEYKKKLNRLTNIAFHETVAETLTTVSSFAHAQQAKNVRARFVLRNRYTEGSLKHYKATPKAKLWKINAVTGSISDYMDLQEKGGQRKPKKGRKAPVVTVHARGGNRRAVVRKKYYARRKGPNLFVGTPRGGNRPSGVWERYAHNRRIRLIRNLSQSQVAVVARHWHRDAMSKYAKQQVIIDAFIQIAKRRMSNLS